MADAKISELPEVLSAPDNAWIVIVVRNAEGVDVTSKIRKSALIP